MPGGGDGLFLVSVCYPDRRDSSHSRMMAIPHQNHCRSFLSMLSLLAPTGFYNWYYVCAGNGNYTGRAGLVRQFSTFLAGKKPVIPAVAAGMCGKLGGNCEYIPITPGIISDFPPTDP